MHILIIEARYYGQDRLVHVITITSHSTYDIVLNFHPESLSFLPRGEGKVRGMWNQALIFSLQKRVTGWTLVNL